MMMLLSVFYAFFYNNTCSVFPISVAFKAVLVSLGFVLN